MKKIPLIFIIILFPALVAAHGDVPHLSVDAGTLPGGIKYSFERLGEWFSVNLLTVSTKAKQEKYLKQAEERLAELEELYSYADQKEKNLNKALAGYRSSLSRAEDMAEKIIFLDGTEIAIAYDLEKKTRTYEKVMGELLEENAPKSDSARQAMTAAREQNEKIFKFIVEKYQFNDGDIEKNKAIIADEINFAESKAKGLDKQKAGEISGHIKEARNFLKFGLNMRAYDEVKKAKDILY